MSGIISRDAVAAVVWVAVNMLLALAAWRLSHAMMTTDGATLPSHLLNSLTMSLGCVTGITTMLGSIGILTTWSLVVAVAVVATAVILAVPAHRRAVGPPCIHIESREASRRWTFPVSYCLWGFVGTFLAGHIFTEGLLSFPTDFDCLMYHIPLVDHWLQAGSLYAPDSAFWSQPAGSEIVALWCVAPFSGDFLVGLNNLPFVCLWGLAAYSLCRTVGISRPWSHLSACAILFVHTLIHESDDASNDLAVVALLMATLNFGFRFVRFREPIDLNLGGITLGLLAGVKFFSLGYAAVAWFAITCAEMVRCGMYSGVRIGARLAMLAILFGGYWYGRNIYYTGEPLYPKTLFKPLDELGYPDLWASSLAFNGDPRVFDLGMEALWTMTGPWQFAAVILTIPAVLYLLVSAMRRVKTGDRDDAAVRIALATAVLGTACVFAIIPLSVEDVPGTLNHLRASYTPARYGLSYLSCAVCGMMVLVADFVVLAKAAERESSTAGVARCLHGAWFIFACGALAYQMATRMTYGSRAPLSERLLIGVVPVGLILGLLVLVHLRRRLQAPIVCAVIATAVITFGATVGILANRWHAGYVAHFDAFFRTAMFSDLKALAGTTDDRICVLDVRSYPFFGSHREWHVVQPRRVTSCDGLADCVNRDRIGFIAARFDISGPVERYNDALPCLFQERDRYRLLTKGSQLELFITRHGTATHEHP